MVNLARDGGRRAELHANYERLLEYEARRVQRRERSQLLRMYSLSG